jgi:hypothetical protein
METAFISDDGVVVTRSEQFAETGSPLVVHIGRPFLTTADHASSLDVHPFGDPPQSSRNAVGANSWPSGKVTGALLVAVIHCSNGIAPAGVMELESIENVMDAGAARAFDGAHIAHRSATTQSGRIRYRLPDTTMILFFHRQTAPQPVDTSMATLK